ncbi:MAG: hypothetical protein COA96_14545 [SAR86 cluster bacterium]|uniref:Uncharacterized protein n=1 Tax=SAR86 cluster bacterium TaxID=2030880 RepID=A0A2A5ASX5_9GAMM|nr:MAG: hypothetical protein COA96_14545 [SAR86 cluster bacterium]
MQADPETNWERVNIAALREHLIDMNLVTLNAEVTTESVEGGARYFITGQGRILAAIKNMVPTHAAQVMTEIGWKTQTDTRSDGVELIVTSENPSQVVQIRALGFMGFMVQGDHHGAHHLMIAGATQGEHGNHGGGSHSEH